MRVQTKGPEWPRRPSATRKRAAPSDIPGSTRSECLVEALREQRDHLSVKLDDPSFKAPIYANLVQDEDGVGFALIWSRSRKANAD